MSRKLTKSNNLFNRSDGDSFKNCAATAYALTEWKGTEVTNQSEQETTDSQWKKYDEIIQEKYAIIKDLKSQIRQINIENLDLYEQLTTKIILSKLSEGSHKPKMNKSRARYSSLTKLKRKVKDKRMYSRDDIVMKIELKW